MTAEEAKRYYNGWKGYESDLRRGHWNAPEVLVRELRRRLKNGAQVLDVGCGTGLVGAAFRKLGWRGTLLGVDIARARLREAAAKTIYSRLLTMNAYRLRFPSEKFDAVVSVAMVGLTGPQSVREMWRVLKPGGLLACVVLEKSRSAQFSRNGCSLGNLIRGAERILVKDLRFSCRKDHREHYTLHIFRKTERSLKATAKS